MRRLHEIRADMQAAIDKMIDGTDAEVLGAADLEDLDIEATEKLRACFFVINGRLLPEIAEADMMIALATAYKAVRIKAIERIEADVKLTMEVAGLDKLDQPDCRMTLGAASTFVELLDAKLLTTEYLRIIPAVAESTAPDKKAIMDALKQHIEVAGAQIGYGERRLTYPKIKGE